MLRRKPDSRSLSALLEQEEDAPVSYIKYIIENLEE